MSLFSDLLKEAEKAHLKDDKKIIKTTNINRLKFSNEQEEFLNSYSQRMVLTALAGSGKTSMLMEYARRNTNKKWNFLVFNRSVAEEVKLICPKNVSVKTAHQLAFAKHGASLQDKIRDDFSKNQIKKICSFINKEALNDYTELVIKTLNEFLNSSDQFISKDLISVFDFNLLQEKYPNESFNIDKLNETVNLIWRKSLDENSDLLISHDVYLKRFSMSDSQWMGQNWMLDEGQDWSDSFLSCWRKQDIISIRAGDPYQKLYEWRSANSQKWINEEEKEYWLSNSFRTGKGIEDWVNFRLNNLNCPKSWSGNNSFDCNIFHVEENIKEIVNFNPNIILASRRDILKYIYDDLTQSNIRCSIKEAGNEKQKLDGIILSTIHASKGLEYDNVWIANECLSENDNAINKSRLAYVALTRAKNNIRIPNSWGKTKANNESLFDSIF